jgi:hypothetical protein
MHAVIAWQVLGSDWRVDDVGHAMQDIGGPLFTSFLQPFPGETLSHHDLPAIPREYDTWMLESY